MHASSVKLLHQLNPVHRVTVQPGQAAHLDDVALPHRGQQLVERGAARTGTRYLLLEEAGAAGVWEIFDLNGRVLIGGGNVGVAERMLHDSRNIDHKLTLRNLFIEPEAGLRKG